MERTLETERPSGVVQSQLSSQLAGAIRVTPDQINRKTILLSPVEIAESCANEEIVFKLCNLEVDCYAALEN